MKNSGLSRPVSDRNYRRKHRCTIYRAVFIAIFVSRFVLLGTAATDTCTDCHIKPEYKNADKARLKECLACHRSEGHSYKEGIVGVAVAADIDHRTEPASIPADLKYMVLIPAGEFIMGTEDRLRDEKPLHVVYIDAFYIDRYEVTNKEFKGFVEATRRTAPENWRNYDYPEGKGNHPVIFVDWHDADSYCKWLGKRLPREREWEKAARGTDGRVYPWGDKWDIDKSNNPLRGYNGTMPVGSFENGRSPYGLYDMSGNVWEWVNDEYLPHPGSDYVSPEFGKKYKLLKGGSWWDCMFYGCGISAPTFNRAFFDPSTQNDSFGFRCAADVE